MDDETLASPDVQRPMPSHGEPSPGVRRDWRWWVGGAGRILIVTGLMLLAFVGFQLWGTGIQQARSQDALGGELAALEQQVAPPSTGGSTVAPGSTTTTSTTPGSPTTPPSTSPAPATVAEGDPIGVIEIPAIGVRQYLVAGVRVEDLRAGPGHYTGTPLPGQTGNAAIAGHRTTYGQPFIDLDDLVPGDEIVVTMAGGDRFVYRVTGSAVVAPTDYGVVLTSDPDVATLTLTTCHPKYSAAQRLVVSALLDGEASDPVGSVRITYAEDTATTTPGGTPPVDTTPVVPSTPSSDTVDAFQGGWFADSAAWPHAIGWGAALAAVAYGASRLGRAMGRRWVGVLAGAIPFLVVLYFFFENLNRLLPPNL